MLETLLRLVLKPTPHSKETSMSNRFVRFLFVGGLNTLFGLAVFSLFALTELPTWVVLILANIAAIAFNFFTTGGIVFRDMRLNRLPKFLICYGIIFLIYWILIEWLSPIIGGRVWAMSVIVIPMAVLTYLIQSWFVFNDVH